VADQDDPQDRRQPDNGPEAGAAQPPRPSGSTTPHAGGRGRKIVDRLLPIVTGSAAVVPLVGLALMVVVLLLEAWPAIRFNGLHFISSGTWSVGSFYSNPVTTNGVTHPPGASYGALDLILGTIEASAIAVAIGFPIAIGGAILVVEKLPRRLSGLVGLTLETLAGIPSVIFGLWGILTLGPFLAHHVYPALAHLPNVPVLNIFRGNVGDGEGLLTAGVVLAVMIIPIVAATTRDLLRQVPAATKEGAWALGMTDAEGFRTVQLRWVRSGVIAAGVLGLGRALGETIAVAMVSGSVIGLSSNIYGNMTTIAATIVSQLDSAQGDPTLFAVKSLAEAALVLMLITLIVNVAARLLVRRVSATAVLPVGAGF
jgi:phosphate transport system permease protein